MRAVIVGAVLAVLALTACSDGEDPAETGSQTPVPQITSTVETSVPETISTPEASLGNDDVAAAQPEPAATPRSVATRTPSLGDTDDTSQEIGRVIRTLPTGEDSEQSDLSRLLRVVDVESCLNLRSRPYIEAEILTCIPLGAYVEGSSYSPYAIEGRDGVTWRGLGWPIWGFANNRYLGGPEPTDIISLPPYVASEEFPEVAVLGPPDRRQWLPRPSGSLAYPPQRLDRVYRRSDGEVVRETLMTLEELEAVYPDAFSEIRGLRKDWGHIIFGPAAVTPDGSHMHIGVCTYVEILGDPCTGTLGLFRSTDGGVTWSHLGNVVSDDWGDVTIAGVLPGEELQLVVLIRQGQEWRWEVKLFPSGETRVIGRQWYAQPEPTVRSDKWQLLRDGRLATRAARNFSPVEEREYLWLAEDGADLGAEVPDHLKVALPETSPIPSDLLRHYLPGDDPPADHPYHNIHHSLLLYLYYLESILSPVIVQQGPFLQVIGVGEDCLPIRAEPSPDADELACAVERVLLQDQDEAVEVDGATWLKVETPAGVVGWADGRYLE